VNRPCSEESADERSHDGGASDRQSSEDMAEWHGMAARREKPTTEEKIGGGQDCPVTDCKGTNHGKRFFQLDEELIRKIIEKSCSEEDSQSALNNGVNTDDVAGSSPRNQSQSLTSG